MKTLKHIPFELIFWIGAMILLATANPDKHGDAQHFTLCPLANMGFSWCPGCGIGRSITQVFHGNFTESFAHHWFGVPALLIICWRIGVLIRTNLINNKLLI
ncbi:hypothetical protein HDC92_000796 [Pedobacter sp. AK017]|uniref:DUF2752 domain-containing protein n=1 Tax=Pedobacter sp. AK017 TaxID=2723073 RepID=UPI001622DE1F|nr:DUF2752 domain-containing protein [Pedobacter sp. AK017]MBB5437128.1 hypothetical protein [Pedobacter sp. AK017]